LGVDRLLVPADTLGDQVIGEAIGRWYRKRFELQRGNWSPGRGTDARHRGRACLWFASDRLGRWDLPGDNCERRVS
jgi:hypothetical protein